MKYWCFQDAFWSEPRSPGCRDNSCGITPDLTAVWEDDRRYRFQRWACYSIRYINSGFYNISGSHGLKRSQDALIFCLLEDAVVRLSFLPSHIAAEGD